MNPDFVLVVLFASQIGPGVLQVRRGSACAGLDFLADGVFSCEEMRGGRIAPVAIDTRFVKSLILERLDQRDKGLRERLRVSVVKVPETDRLRNPQGLPSWSVHIENRCPVPID